MTTIFGGLPEGSLGKPGKTGDTGNDGAKGKPGETLEYYLNWFEQESYKYDINISPNYFIEDYDIKLNPFVILNRNDPAKNFIMTNKNINFLPIKDEKSDRLAVNFTRDSSMISQKSIKGKSATIDNHQLFFVYKRTSYKKIFPNY